MDLILRLDHKFRSAIANFQVPKFSAEITQKIEDAVRCAEDAKMKTFVLNCDMTENIELLGLAYYCPQRGPLKMMRPLKAFDGAFPEPAIFSKSVSVIVWKVIEDVTYVCIIQDLNGGWTAFPAGGAKPKESIAQCGMREVFEETGLTVEPPAELLGIREAVGPLGESNILFNVSMKATGEDDIKIQQCEIKSAEWLPIYEAIERVSVKKAKDILIKFKNGFHSEILLN